MKTLAAEQTTLGACLREAQRERLVVTRNGVPVALVVGVEGLDDEQVHWGSSDELWALIAERRRQKTLSRAEVERKSGEAD